MKKPIKLHAPLHFRDATGHVDEWYAADLQALSHAGAQPPDPVGFSAAAIRRDPFAEELAEEFVRTVTCSEDDADQDPTEEMGGLAKFSVP